MLSTSGVSMKMGIRLRIVYTWRQFATRSQSTVAATAALNPRNGDVTAANALDEYTDEPIYPKINDLSFKARKKREFESWHDQIRNVPTVEEKLIKMNMPRYYGYKVVELGDTKLPYNCLPAIQHYTRTIYEDINVDTKAQPPATDESQGTVVQKNDKYVEECKNDIKDAIEFVHDYFRHQYGKAQKMDPKESESLLARLIVDQVNRTLINVLSPNFVHLQDADVDCTPRHEAFWSVGGINPPKSVVRSKKGRSWQKEMANDPYDRYMQYTGKPYLTVRHRNQLPTWKAEEEITNADLAKTIPRFEYDPRTLGYVCDYKRLTSIPGFWPGSRNPFGCISYQSRAFLKIRPDSFGSEDFKEALHAQAIQSSYAWLLAQATYNGFNTFNDLTYPMNTQTVLTDGRHFSFYEYQLNTLLVHSNQVDVNPRVNFCRGTLEMQLYSDVSDTGKIVDFNDDVLGRLIRFYTNIPNIQRSNDELQPYLGPDVKYIADYKNVEQREFLESTFKYLMSNRPRHLAIPEIYLWEKIYKIDHKTRPMEARRRYFELGINPWRRTLDQHQKEYIPKVERPEGPKSKKKWKPTYYP